MTTRDLRGDTRLEAAPALQVVIDRASTAALAAIDQVVAAVSPEEVAAMEQAVIDRHEASTPAFRTPDPRGVPIDPAMISALVRLQASRAIRVAAAEAWEPETRPISRREQAAAVLLGAASRTVVYGYFRGRTERSPAMQQKARAARAARGE